MPRRTKTEGSQSEDFGAEIAARSADVIRCSAAQRKISENDVITLYAAAKFLFRALIRRDGFSEDSVKALLTKFNDAGPRSAPWKPTSSRVPGRPQDGKDGNRINRWELPKEHKFYANRIDGTLVAIKYIFQTLSMTDAPTTPDHVSKHLIWLVGHEIKPGTFRDPIQRIEVSLKQVIENPRIITSGHMVPLDRKGRHVPENTSLILKLSNDLQGNNTIDELLQLIRGILSRHGRL